MNLPGPGPVPPPDPPAPVTGSYTLKVADGSELYIYYDETDGLVHYEADVNDSSYLAIGYRSAMTNTNIVVWLANGDNSVQTNTYATGYALPGDIPNIYTTTFEYDTVNGIVKFHSTRELDPAGVDSRNFVIELDTKIPLIYAWVEDTTFVKYHESNRDVDFMTLSID